MNGRIATAQLNLTSSDCRSKSAVWNTIENGAALSKVILPTSSKEEGRNTHKINMDLLCRKKKLKKEIYGAQILRKKKEKGN